MHLPFRARFARGLLALGLAFGALLPAATATLAADPIVLTAGTDQDLQVMNPWNSVLVVDFEVFTLNYDLLVNFGQNLEPAAGFADKWEPDSTNTKWTFHIRDGMKWSDGTPATSEDARFTYQLVIDAAKQELTLGSGYLEPYLSNAGLKAVTAPDPQTLVVETSFPNQLILQAYVPILPKHIWSKVPIKDIASTFANPVPVVGTGPYQAVEFKPGQFIRFQRNPNYWGKKGAADEVVIQHFANSATMVQALKNKELDYMRGVGADEFDQLAGQPDIKTVEGIANGYTYLSFNMYSKPIPGGGATTTAFRDRAFRDALGWAIDTKVLVDRILAGHGTPGSTLVPPYHTRWHVDPPADIARSFDIAKAKTLLDAAGYKLDAAGKRLDKAGKPLPTLRLTWPSSESELATAGQFIKEWFAQLGIPVEASVTEEGKLLDDLLPPEADGKANWDMYMWGWVGDPDPSSLLKLFTTEQIGNTNDMFYASPEYDRLFNEQLRATDEAKRKDLISQLQILFYKDAPNIPLYYDSELHAYRTDKFAGWTNQPVEGGTPLFGYGSIGYSTLADAKAVASAAPSAVAGASGSAGPAASGGTTPAPTSSTSSTLPIVIGAVVLIAIVAVGLLFMRRRPKAGEEE